MAESISGYENLPESDFDAWWAGHGPCEGNQLFRNGNEYMHTLITSYARAAWNAAQLAHPSAEGDGWVAVTERLPQDKKAKLVWCPERRNRYMACWYEGKWWYFGGWREVEEEVTHWTEALPAPPAQEGKR